MSKNRLFVEGHGNPSSIPLDTPTSAAKLNVSWVVNSVLLIVDAFEGPIPQIVSSFESTRPWAQAVSSLTNVTSVPPDQVLDSVFDLFVSLGANDEQLDFRALCFGA